MVLFLHLRGKLCGQPPSYFGGTILHCCEQSHDAHLALDMLETVDQRLQRRVDGQGGESARWT